jgi:hypothetical protein
MNYLIIGAIVCLAGVGLMMQGKSVLGLLGIIIFLIGGSIGLKGRRKLDRK